MATLFCLCLVAIKLGEILLIQCKSSKYNLSKKEKTEILSLAKSIGARAVLAYREENTLKLKEIKDEA